jgi:hypothetical protein
MTNKKERKKKIKLGFYGTKLPLFHIRLLHKIFLIKIQGKFCPPPPPPPHVISQVILMLQSILTYM